MKGIIIYKGKYGATEQYATWLAEQTGLEKIPSSQIGGQALRQYDFFVLGSSVYIGKLQLRKWMQKNLPYLRGKKIFFFQIAAAPPEEVEKRKTYDRSAPLQLMGSAECFYMPGKMIMKDLSWVDRFMLKMGARMAKDPKAKKEMLTDFDHVEKNYTLTMTTAINKWRQSSASASR